MKLILATLVSVLLLAHGAHAQQITLSWEKYTGTAIEFVILEEAPPGAWKKVASTMPPLARGRLNTLRAIAPADRTPAQTAELAALKTPASTITFPLTLGPHVWTIIAADEWGLESLPSTPLTFDAKPVDPVKGPFVVNVITITVAAPAGP